MVNEAYILSNTGLAFFKEGRQWYTLRADAPDAPRPLHTFDRNTINLGNSEVLHLNKPHHLEALQDKLKQQAALQDTLTASLQLMDPKIKRSSTKQLLINYLRDQFKQPDFLDFVRHRLWSVPLPATFDPKEALSHIDDSGEQKELLQLYAQLDAEREAITQFDVCWKKTAYQSKQIYDQNSVELIHHALVDGGWVKAFIGSIFRRSKKEWDAAVLGSTLLLQKQRMRVNALLFVDLLKELTRTYAIVLEDSSYRPPEMNEGTSTKAADPIQMMISRYLEEYSENKKKRRYVKGDYSKRAKKKKKRNFDYHDSEKIQRNVDYLSDEIAERVKKGKFVSADSYLKQLLEAQFATSSPEQICKSLCNVAERVKQHYSFADRLLHYAMQLNSEDVVPHTQLAEALKIQRKYDRSIEVYKKAIVLFPNDAVPRNGLAEVLKAQGKLDEAKAQFERNARQFPNDDFSRNGLAEVLKAQGKLDKAKAQFERNARQFPNDSVSRNGLAEALKAQGKLDKAKAQFERNARQFPNDSVSRNGLAEVLKAQGKLDEAKDLFEETIKDFPNDAVPRTGLAEVLKAQGKLDEAKAQFERNARQFPNDDFSRNGLAEVLKAQGKLDEAKAQFERNARQFPNDSVSRNGLAEVLKAQGKLDEAKAQFERNARQFPNDGFSRNGLAEVLKAQGKLDEAKDLFEKTIKDFPNDAVPRNGLAGVLKAQGKLQEAKAAYRSILEVFPNNDYAQHALAALHLQLDEDSAFEALIPKSLSTPVTVTDYYWDHLAITNLIKQGGWDEAETKLQYGIDHCPFYPTKKLYQRTLKYLNIQNKQFDTLLQELSEPDDTPVDHLINTHAYAVTNQTEKAKAALERCKIFKDMQLIYETSCLLSERFDINGLPRQGLSTAELNRQIREKELMAITIIQ